MSALEPHAGFLDPELARELPGLRLRTVELPARPGRTPAALAARLRELSDRLRGIDAVALRTRPLPRVYRAFYRQLGLDPDTERVAAERLAVERLLEGGLRPRERIVDACRVAIAETGVDVRALDASTIAPGGLGIRLAGRAEPAPGSLVLADAARAHAPLFGEPLPGSGPSARTRAVMFCAVGVPGVPEIHLHEALWQAADALALH